MDYTMILNVSLLLNLRSLMRPGKTLSVTLFAKKKPFQLVTTFKFPRQLNMRPRNVLLLVLVLPIIALAIGNPSPRMYVPLATNHHPLKSPGSHSLMRIGNFCGIIKGVSVVVRLMLDFSGKIALSGLVVLEVIVAGILVVQ